MMKVTRLLLCFVCLFTFISISQSKTSKLEGKIIYFSDRDKSGNSTPGTSLFAIDLATKKIKKLFTFPDYAGYDFIYSPDHKYIGTYCIKDKVKDTWILTTDGKLVRKIPGQCTDWSSDGKSLVGLEAKPNDDSDNKLFVVNVDGTNRRYFQSAINIFSDPSWSSDSKKIAYLTQKSYKNDPWTTLWIVDKESQKQKAVWKYKGVAFAITWIDNNYFLVMISNFLNTVPMVIDTRTGKSREYKSMADEYGFQTREIVVSVFRKTRQAVCVATDPYPFKSQKIYILNFNGLRISSRSITPIINEDTASLSLPVFSPSGNQVAYFRSLLKDYQSFHNDIVIIDKVSGAKLLVIKDLPNEPVAHYIHWID